MKLLIILTLINVLFISVFFLAGKPGKMTYTETIIFRKIVAYLLTLLGLVFIGLLLLKANNAVQIIALTLNIIFTITLIIYFVDKLSKSR